MSVAYLAAGLTSMAAGGWSDATGPAADATLVIAEGGAIIADDIDFSALSPNGIDWLDIRAGFYGQIGTPTSYFKVACDKTGGLNRIRYGASAGVIYLEPAGSDSNNIGEFENCGGGRAYIANGGTVALLTATSGETEVGPGTSITNLTQNGGQTTIRYKSAAMTTLNLLKGSALIQRGMTTLNVGPGMTVVVDLSQGGSMGTVNLNGGRLVHLAGDITKINAYSGVYDCAQLKKNAAITNADVYPNAVFMERGTAGAPTFTNPISWKGSPLGSGPTPI